MEGFDQKKFQCFARDRCPPPQKKKIHIRFGATAHVLRVQRNSHNVIAPFSLVCAVVATLPFQDGVNCTLLCVRRVQIFQEQLRNRQPEIERITELADEILSACHPNAVRFVRYYLTITQTRWTQAVHRSDQRSARMQV